MLRSLDCFFKQHKWLPLFIGALLFVTGGAWFADFLRELLILRENTDGWIFSSRAWLWVVISFLIWLLGAWLVYYYGKDLVTFRPHLDRQEVVPHQVLVLLVSQKGKDDGFEHARKLCSRDIRQDIERFANDEQLKHWPWLQQLRAVEPHLGTLQRVVLVGSKDGERIRGTVHDLDDCRRFLKEYLPKLEIDDAPYFPNFEEINDLKYMVDRVIERVKKHGCEEKDVIFDVTGGTKTASIAVALSTLDRPEVDFQYVTQSDNRPSMYNLVGSISNPPR